MTQSEVCPFVKKFPFFRKETRGIDKAEIILARVDEVKIKELTPIALNMTLTDKVPKGDIWNPSYEEGYDEQGRWVILKNEGWRKVDVSFLETLKTIANEEIIAIVDIFRKGGYDVPTNKDDYGYGKRESMTIHMS